MSQNRDPDYPVQDHIPQGGRDDPLGYARRYTRRQNGTHSSRGHRRRLLIMTGVAIVLFAWGIAGGLVVSMNSTAATPHSASKPVLSTSQIASRTDPGLADVVSTDSYQQAAAAGTGIVLTSTGEVLTNNHVIEALLLSRSPTSATARATPRQWQATTRLRTWQYCSCRARPA